MRVGIVGSGIIGTSTAAALLEAQPQLSVTLLSDRTPSEMTSSGPPGLFRPVPYAPLERTRAWAKATHAHLRRLVGSAEAAEAGVAVVGGAVLSNDQDWLTEAQSVYSDLVDGFRPHLDADERAMYAAVPYKYGFGHSAFVTPGKSYFPYMQRKAASLGAVSKRQKVENLAELGNDYDVVFNCSGLGARHLANDDTVQPVRGVLIEVEAPWIKHFCFGGNNLSYIIPTLDSLMIGGTRDVGVSDRAHSDADTQRILADAFRNWPSLRHAKMIGEWVGLRPWRPSPRVELQRLPNGLPVIHNYGHGGNGFVLSWGCAEEAVGIFQEFQRRSKL